MTVTERRRTHRIEIGLYGFSETVFDFNGEQYIARATGEATYGIDGSPTFRIELVYPELPNLRCMELTPMSDGCVLMKLSEVPNNRIVEPFIESLPVTNPKLAFAQQMLERRFGADFIKNRLSGIFYPSLLLVREDLKNRDEIIGRETEIANESDKMVKNIVSLISRFVKENSVTEETAESSEENDKQGFISGIVDMIKKRLSPRSK